MQSRRWEDFFERAEQGLRGGEPRGEDSLFSSRVRKVSFRKIGLGNELPARPIAGVEAGVDMLDFRILTSKPLHPVGSSFNAESTRPDREKTPLGLLSRVVGVAHCDLE